MADSSIPKASDLVIEALALDDALLRERLIDLTLERDSYRELAQSALHRIAALTRQLKRLTHPATPRRSGESAR